MTKKQDELLRTARERMQACVDAEYKNRAAAVDDLRFLKGEQWDTMARKQRELEGRPCLTFNQLPAIIQQVTNDQRQNTPSIKVHPVDDNADIETAEVLQGLIRHIEYSSDADVAYDTAVNAAATHGFGAWRLLTDYESPDSFNQVIRFQRIRNSLSVYIDPYSQCPVGSDMRYCMITDVVPKSTFEREFPKAKATDTLAWEGVGDNHRNGWLRDDGVVVAEYYWVDLQSDTLLLLQDGSTMWKSDLLETNLDDAQNLPIVKERTSMRRRIKWAKLTGVDVLDEKEIPGNWIPVFVVQGQEVDIEGEVFRWGVVRNAKDPVKAYNFWLTSATEEVAMRPKTPYIGAEGQFEGHEAQWSVANRSSIPYLEYKPVSVNGQIAPPPQRQPMADIPAGVLQMAMHARDNLKSTTGLYDASLGAQGNETSGRAILARQKEGDTANFHFTDNLNRAIRHCGRVLVDMIPYIYDTERVIRIRGEDDTISSAHINEQGVDRVVNDITTGKYDVTISAGPSYTTQRQEAVEAMTQFAQSWPRLMDIAGDKVVANMDWPGAEEIAERIKRSMPPGMVDDEEAPQIPPEIQQQIQQMDQAIQGLTQELEAAENGLEKARIDAASRERVAEINAQARMDVEELKGMVSMLLQRMQPPPEFVTQAYNTGVPEQRPETEQIPPSVGAPEETRADLPPAGFDYAPDAGGLPEIPPTGQETIE